MYPATISGNRQHPELNGQQVMLTDLTGVKHVKIRVLTGKSAGKQLSVRAVTVKGPRGFDTARDLFEFFANIRSTFAATTPRSLEDPAITTSPMPARLIYNVASATEKMLRVQQPLSPSLASTLAGATAFFKAIAGEIDKIVNECKANYAQNVHAEEMETYGRYEMLIDNFQTFPMELSLTHVALAVASTNMPFTGLVGYAEPRPSPIHGTGLFATRDIPKGGLISYYRNDMLFRKFAVGWLPIISLRGTDSVDAYDNLDLSFLHGTFLGDVEFNILAEPSMPGADDQLAHLINSPSTDADEASRLQNCEWMIIMGGAISVAFAIRDIPAGSEILVDYGEDYWERQLRKST